MQAISPYELSCGLADRNTDDWRYDPEQEGDTVVRPEPEPCDSDDESEEEEGRRRKHIQNREQDEQDSSEDEEFYKQV